MSEFPFSPDASHEDAAPGRDKRTLLLAGGLAAAVLAGGGYFFLGSGGGEDSFEAAPITPSRSSAAEGTTSAASKSATTVKVLPAAATIQTGRNPFKVLYTAPETVASSTAVVTGTAPVTSTDASGATGTTGSGSAPGTPVLTDSSGISPVTPTSPTTATSEYPIRLTSVSAPQGQVRVVSWRIGGKDVEVIPGQKFGNFGELVVLAFPLKADKKTVAGVILQVGDATPQTVGIGQTVSVL